MCVFMELIDWLNIPAQRFFQSFAILKYQDFNMHIFHGKTTLAGPSFSVWHTQM